MANTVTLTFAGDAKALERAAAAAKAAIDGVGKQVKDSGAQFEKAGKDAAGFRDRMDRLGSKTFETVSSLDAAKGAIEDLIDAQQAAKQATVDLSQAQEDLNQSQLDAKQAARDGAQSVLDIEQAMIDADAAQRDYNAAVKEFGANSIEARQAALDMKQAQEDVNQANLDGEQATADARQASIDAQQAAVDMAAAQRESADVTKIMSMAIAAATIAQLAFNVAMTLNPIGLVVVAVAALIAAVVLIATKTTWFQDLWKVAWGWIKKTAMDVWEWLQKVPGMLGDAFKRVVEFIYAPFRTAFNLVAKAWNATIGKLSWTVPGWIPGIGGNTISAPKLPVFHQGGVMPGAPGSEGLALLKAGEQVTPAGQSGGSMTLVVTSEGASDMDRLFVAMIQRLVRNGQLKLVRA
jgi:hypothetical protein